jgi:hypothetical protein
MGGGGAARVRSHVNGLAVLSRCQSRENREIGQGFREKMEIPISLTGSGAYPHGAGNIGAGGRVSCLIPDERQIVSSNLGRFYADRDHKSHLTIVCIGSRQKAVSSDCYI